MSLLSRLTAKREKAVEVTVSNRTVVRVILLIVGTVIFLRFLSLASSTLVLIGVSAFLAIALNPAVSWISHKLKSKSRVRATAVAYVSVIAILASFITFVIPPLVDQTIDFIQDVPRIVSDFQTQDSALARTVRRYDLDDQLQSASRDFADRFKDVESITSTAGSILGTVVSIITVLVLTFMMLVEGPVWFSKVWEIYQNDIDEKQHKRVLERMYKVITGYVNGQVLIALIAGSFALVALFIVSSILNVTINAVALAGIIVLFGLIPMIGNTLGAAVVVLVSMLTSFPLAIIMGIFFLVYQQVENVTIQPFIQSRNSAMTPLLVFAAALIGGSVGGILGAFVAIPTAGCLKVAFEEYYLKQRTTTAEDIK